MRRRVKEERAADGALPLRIAATDTEAVPGTFPFGDGHVRLESRDGRLEEVGLDWSSVPENFEATQPFGIGTRGPSFDLQLAGLSVGRKSGPRRLAVDRGEEQAFRAEPEIESGDPAEAVQEEPAAHQHGEGEGELGHDEE